MLQLSREPAAPWRIWLRTTGYHLRPPRAVPHVATQRRRQDALLAGNRAGLTQCAQIRLEQRLGPLPTIVVGGFVPDATEALYLLRGQLLQQGSIYYLHYPHRGFSTELFLAQLEDLIEEVTNRTGHRPVLVGISFGGGMILEMLRRAAERRDRLTLAGLVLISPVACLEDLVDPAEPKPTTLLGRVLRPYLATEGTADAAVVDKSRAVFLKMFESGVQNKAALRFLLTPEEARRLRAAVAATINAIDTQGATERVQALRCLPAPGAPGVLHAGPTLILYAEKESAVLVENSPTRLRLESYTRDWFPAGTCQTVTHSPDNPVQHASLIFHSQCFAPLLASFYQKLRQRRRLAA